MASRAHKGRGALGRPEGRFAVSRVEPDAEAGWQSLDIAPDTELRAMQSRSIISTNDSPDVPFNRSINPYQGCEHGCIYCYARPSHSYLDLSPGLDFESRIFYKSNAARLLRESWEKAGYQVESITLGANTDPYQPAEKRLRITRELLELFARHEHPCNLITKGTLIERDIDLLAKLAGKNLCSVAISLPSLDAGLKRIMEPRVPSAGARLKTIRRLNDAGIPTHVLVAPIIPAINDGEIEAILEAAAEAGACGASWVFLRLPHEVRTLFSDWLSSHFPDRAEHVMSLVRQASGGRDYDHRFGLRQQGRGPYADMIARRFAVSAGKLGLVHGEYQRSLDTSRFRKPGDGQLGFGF